MILICGIPSETPTALVIEAAKEEGIDHFVFSQRDSQETEMSLDLGGGSCSGTITTRGHSRALHLFRGAYVRLMDHTFLPENRAPGADREKVSRSWQVHQTLAQWAEIATCRIMNRNGNMSSNMSKPYQARLISQCGFKIPPTLVTNDPDEALTFKKSHGRVIFKSISAERSIVKELTGAKLAELRKIRFLPTQFQALVPGVDVRVHVVGSSVFAARIETGVIDYRYAAQEGSEVRMQSWTPPEELTRRCLELSRHLGLPLCGIDLKETPEGEYFCFEVNPSPGFSYYQERTKEKISHAIVRYLEEGD